MSKHRLIEIFLEVIRINSLSGNEKPLADFIRSFLEKYKYDVIEDKTKQFTN